MEMEDVKKRQRGEIVNLITCYHHAFLKDQQPKYCLIKGLRNSMPRKGQGKEIKKRKHHGVSCRFWN